jgi:hypothetical protein
MAELHPSPLFDRLAVLQDEERACIAEIRGLEAEEKLLVNQLKKAKSQLRYYDEFLAEAARGMRGGRKGLKDLLDRLRVQ